MVGNGIGAGLRRLLAALKRSYTLRVPVLFLLACALSYVSEHYIEHLSEQGKDHPGVTQSLFNMRGLYQYVVASWPRRLVPRYTVIVEIDPENDPTAVSLHNICDQREFLSRFVSTLAKYEPKVIVIDKFFTELGCKSDHPSTIALQRAIADVSRPIVVGLRIDEHAIPSKNREAWPVVNALGFPDAPKIREAIINIDNDSRRLAFGWSIIRRENSAPKWQNAVALQAALDHDPNLFKNNPSLKELVDRRKHPYLSLIPRDRFPTYLTGDVLCNTPLQDEYVKRACRDYKKRSIDLEYIRGRIAVIGEVHRDMDVHFTTIGRVPGFVLQANYVEALLDERYFKPVPHWVDYLIGFVFFVAIEFALHQKSPIRCIVGVIGATAITLLILFLTVRFLGYYVNPVTVSALVLGIKLVVWFSERLVPKGGH